VVHLFIIEGDARGHQVSCVYNKWQNIGRPCHTNRSFQQCGCIQKVGR